MRRPPAPLHRHVVDGLAVIRRRPTGPPSHTVVLVHGAMDRAASFGRVMRRLGDRDVVAYDRRGYAGSPGPGAGTGLDAHVADVASIARWARPERLVLVGHSLGGLLCLLATQDHLEGLPIVAVASFEAPMPWLERDDRGSGGTTLEVARRQGAGAAAEFFYRAMVGDRAWERLGERDRAARRAEGPALVAELEAVRSPDAGFAFEGTTAPSHVGRGERSSDHLRAAAQRMAEILGVRCEEIAGAGHGAHLSHPDEFARWIRAMG